MRRMMRILENVMTMSKGGRSVDPYVICPYYKSEDKQAIYCEGPEKNASARMAFSSTSQKKKYLVNYCRKYRCGCLWAEALNKKYGGDGE